MNKRNKTRGGIGTNQYKIRGVAKPKNEKLRVRKDHNGVKKQKTIIMDSLDGLSEEDIDALKNTNPGMEEFSGMGVCNPFRRNCQRCAITFELRRRGDNVKAKPKPTKESVKDLTYGDLLAKMPEYAWRDSKTNHRPELEKIKIVDMDNAVNEIANYITQHYPPGEKRVFTLQWYYKKEEGGGGHIIIVQQIDGKLYFIDPQIGKNAGYLNSYFSTVIDLKKPVSIVRIDDKKFVHTLFTDICQPSDEPYIINKKQYILESADKIKKAEKESEWMLDR